MRRADAGGGRRRSGTNGTSASTALRARQRRVFEPWKVDLGPGPEIAEVTTGSPLVKEDHKSIQRKTSEALVNERLYSDSSERRATNAFALLRTKPFERLSRPGNWHLAVPTPSPPTGRSDFY
jgi:hypothetical protein